MELQQLEKTYKAGIINQKEFEKGKERIESRMMDVEQETLKKEEGKKIVAEILEEPKEEPQAKIREKKEPRVKKESKPVPKSKKKSSQKKPKKDDDDYDEEGAFSKFIIFAGIVAIILLLVLVRIFTGDAPAERDLSGVEGVVELDVYLDFNCKYAPQAWQTMLDLKKTYGDNLAVRVQHFPMSLDAFDTANAIQCARDQELHMAYIGRLLENMDSHDVESLKKFAWAEGLEVLDFHECVDDVDHRERIKSDFSEGIDNSVRESPTFFVNGEKIVGITQISSFEEMIDKELGV